MIGLESLGKVLEGRQCTVLRPCHPGVEALGVAGAHQRGERFGQGDGFGHRARLEPSPIQSLGILGVAVLNTP
jgi:hypothetical protein